MKPGDIPLAYTACPHCGYSPTHVMQGAGDTPPSPGHFTVCGGCAEPLRFDAAMQLEAIGADELKALGERFPGMLDAMGKMVAAIQSVRKDLGPPRRRRLN